MRARRYRVLRNALIASRSDEHRAGERRVRRRPATLAAAARVDAARVVVARRGRRRPGPLRHRDGRPGRRVPAAARRSRWCRWRTAPGRRSCVSSAGTTGPAGGTAGRWPWPVRTRRPVPTPSSGWPPTRSAWGGSRHRRRRYGAAVSCSPRSVPPRLPVRLAWVSAELAMATGDGATAVGHAERAIELAAALGSVRHAVKSDVVLAAALCSAGRHRPVAHGC